MIFSRCVIFVENLIFGNFAEFFKIVKPLYKQQVRYIPTQENTGNIIDHFQNLKTIFENFYFFFGFKTVPNPKTNLEIVFCVPENPLFDVFTSFY